MSEKKERKEKKSSRASQEEGEETKEKKERKEKKSSRASKEETEEPAVDKLKTFLRNILSKGPKYASRAKDHVEIVPADELRKLLSSKGMEIWLSAFTHKSSHPEMGLVGNYEVLEKIGDSVLKLSNVSFTVDQLTESGEHRKLTPYLLTVRETAWSQGVTQTALAESLHLDEYIRIANRDGITAKVMEDVYEAFFGALSYTGDSLVERGKGQKYALALFSEMVQGLNLETDAKKLMSKVTELKELYDMAGWIYEVEDRHEGKTWTALVQQGGILVKDEKEEAVATGFTQAEARENAARKALEILRRLDITRDRAQAEAQKEDASILRMLEEVKDLEGREVGLERDRRKDSASGYRLYAVQEDGQRVTLSGGYLPKERESKFAALAAYLQGDAEEKGRFEPLPSPRGGRGGSMRGGRGGSMRGGRGGREMPPSSGEKVEEPRERPRGGGRGGFVSREKVEDATERPRGGRGRGRGGRGSGSASPQPPRATPAPSEERPRGRGGRGRGSRGSISDSPRGKTEDSPAPVKKGSLLDRLRAGEE